jgi:hypothetical protein
MINREKILAALERIFTAEGVKRAVDQLHGDEIVSETDAATTSTSLVDVPELKLVLEKNSLYEVHVHLFAGSSTNAGTKYALSFDGTGSTGANFLIMGATTLNAAQILSIAGLGTASGTFFTAAQGGDPIMIFGYLVTDTTKGTLKVRQLKVTSGTATVYAGSSLRARKVAIYA